MMKEQERKPSSPILNPETGLETRKKVFISVPYIHGLSEMFRRIYEFTGVQVIFKGINSLKSKIFHLKDIVPLNPK